MRFDKGFEPDSRHAKSLDISWKEGIPAAFMIAVTDYYLIPLALFWGANPMEVGLLVAIPQLLGAFAQLVAVRAVRLIGTRLGFLVKTAAAQAATLAPVALLSLLEVPGRVAILIVLVTAFRVLGNLIGTVWGSLASDYLQPEKRGLYFGWRNQITGAAGVLGVIFGGLLLYAFRSVSEKSGFAILFLLTSLARFLSAGMMNHMEDLPVEDKPESHFSFYRFIARFRQSNFVKFVFYVGAITFATNLSAPYFNVYMLRDLNLNYFQYMLIHLSAVAGSVVSFPVWGRHADHFGNAKILKVSSLLIPLVPLLWLLPPSVPLLVLVEIYAGFVWGGFNLCSLNFIYDAVTPDKRVRCLGYFNLINGVAVFAGATLGGLVADRLPPLMGYRLFSLFLISGLLRIACHFLLSGKFREVRTTAKAVSGRKLLASVVGIRPLFVSGTRNWNIFMFFKKPASEQ